MLRDFLFYLVYYVCDFGYFKSLLLLISLFVKWGKLQGRFRDQMGNKPDVSFGELSCNSAKMIAYIISIRKEREHPETFSKERLQCGQISQDSTVLINLFLQTLGVIAIFIQYDDFNKH
jgi:hypothetical protein